jgi:hypothetical protein
MTNIQPFDNPQYYFKIEDLQRIFEKHNLRPEHPVDYAKFVQDINEICTVNYVLSDVSYTILDRPGRVPHNNFNTYHDEAGTTNIPKK